MPVEQLENTGEVAKSDLWRDERGWGSKFSYLGRKMGRDALSWLSGEAGHSVGAELGSSFLFLLGLEGIFDPEQLPPG